jgi:hypothetical protein
VPVECLAGRGGQLLGVGAGGVQGAQQRRGVAAHRLLDQRRLPQAGRGKDLVQVGGVGGQATLAAGLAQQSDQFRRGQPGRVGGGGGGRQQDAGLGSQDPTAGGAERGQQPGVVLAQQRPQLVVGLGAVPDRVLLGTGLPPSRKVVREGPWLSAVHR